MAIYTLWGDGRWPAAKEGIFSNLVCLYICKVLYEIRYDRKDKGFNHIVKVNNCACLRAWDSNASRIQYVGLKIILICQKFNTLEIHSMLEFPYIGILTLLIHQKFQYIRNFDVSQHKYIILTIPQNSNPIAICQKVLYTGNSSLSQIITHEKFS